MWFLKRMQELKSRHNTGLSPQLLVTAVVHLPAGATTVYELICNVAGWKDFGFHGVSDAGIERSLWKVQGAYGGGWIYMMPYEELRVVRYYMLFGDENICEASASVVSNGPHSIAVFSVRQPEEMPISIFEQRLRALDDSLLYLKLLLEHNRNS